MLNQRVTHTLNSSAYRKMQIEIIEIPSLFSVVMDAVDLGGNADHEQYNNIVINSDNKLNDLTNVTALEDR